MPTPDIRMAGPADAMALAALRRAWTAENSGDVAAGGFEARLPACYERESARRLTCMITLLPQPPHPHQAPGFLNQPGRPSSSPPGQVGYRCPKFQDLTAFNIAR